MKINKIRPDKPVNVGSTVKSGLLSENTSISDGISDVVNTRINNDAASSGGNSTSIPVVGPQGPQGPPGRSVSVVWADSVPDPSTVGSNTIVIIKNVGDVYAKVDNTLQKVDNIKGPEATIEDIEQVPGFREAVKRNVSPKIPVTLFTKNYVAKTDDQRFMHVSESPHTLTLLDPKLVKDRRFIVENPGPGDLTVIAKIGTISGVVESVKVTSGESFEVISQFILGQGTDEPSESLTINGSPAVDGVTGGYRYQTVTGYRNIVRKETYETEMASVKSSLQNHTHNIETIVKYGSIAIPTLTSVTTTDLVVNFPEPFPDTSYSVGLSVAGLSAAILAKVSYSVKSKTASSVTVSVAKDGVNIPAGGTISVIAILTRIVK